ncbi:type II secretion system protein [Thalassotalea sp. M1531]|uniref:Type II secretion system protein n=1 Tax=Thalassotalea algicola TaxID=2716224 RepID=A0A7Y0Q6J7_9GAMM|nr:type II secretion system protein [Thalassotalea algicola]NMP30917.1 type II secretion system protein [Thalassotalea algicola]
MVNSSQARGFTLIELVVVIVILGILAATAAPKFLNLSGDAKVATLQAIKGTMESTIKLAQAKARVSGLSPVASNPGAGQSAYVVDFGFGSAEVDFRNLCPESSAELGNQLDMKDFIDIDAQSFEPTVTTNQYTFIGYDIPSSSSPLTNQGCYVIYDSFGDPNCTVTIVTEDC